MRKMDEARGVSRAVSTNTVANVEFISIWKAGDKPSISFTSTKETLIFLHTRLGDDYILNI